MRTEFMKVYEELETLNEASAATEQEKKIIKEAIPTLKDIANRIGPDFAASYIEADKKVSEEYNKVVTEIETLSRGMITRGTTYVPDPTDTKRMFRIAIFPQGVSARVEIEYFAGRPPIYSFWVKSTEVEETVFETILLKHLEELGKRREKFISNSKLDVLKLEETKAQLLDKIEVGRKVQAAVNAGKSVAPDFIAKILATLKQGKEAADKEADFNSRYMDGSSSAAYDSNRWSSITAIAPYLVECNWRSVVNGREIAIWHKTDSNKDLERALKITFNSVCADLNIEILKD